MNNNENVNEAFKDKLGLNPPFISIPENLNNQTQKLFPKFEKFILDADVIHKKLG